MRANQADVRARIKNLYFLDFACSNRPSMADLNAFRSHPTVEQVFHLFMRLDAGQHPRQHRHQSWAGIRRRPVDCIVDASVFISRASAVVSAFARRERLQDRLHLPRTGQIHLTTPS